MPSLRAARTASAWLTSSSMISTVLCSRVTKPTLWPAINEPPWISPSITERRSAPAQKCSISSCACPCESSPCTHRSITRRCVATNRTVAELASARTGITGKRGSSWTDATAPRRGPDEGLLEARVSDRFMCANKAGAELDAGGAHFEIGQHRFPAADPARYENRDLAEMRQDLLRQYAGRDRSNMSARLAAFYDDRIGAHAHELARKTERRCETQDPSAAPLDRPDRGAARQTAGQHHVADPMRRAYLDQVE